MGRMWLLLGFATALAAYNSESQTPAAKGPPPVSAEVAAAPGRLYLTDGRVLPAEQWNEDGNILFYEWHGERRMLPRANVARIEGTPLSREVDIGSATKSTPAARQTAPPPQQHTIRGSLTLVSQLNHYGGACSGASNSGFSDVQAGKQITVTNEAGRVLGIGSLGAGREAESLTCRFGFEVPGLPDAEFYGIELQRRGTLRYSRTDLDRMGWTVAFSLS